MLIAQITDIHLGFEVDRPDEPNRQRLDQVLVHIAAGPNQPDLILATGDLTDRGDRASYRRLRAAIAASPAPVHLMMGNHDDRAAFAAEFPEAPRFGPFVQYCLSFPGLRIVVLDTLEVGRHGGGFCAERAAWLAERLAEDRDTPTVLAMHHPPFPAGIAWMETSPGEPWVARLADAIGDHPAITAIWCGHLHRAIAGRWRSIPVTVCPATSAGLSLDLREIDPAAPDGRAMVVADTPGYALHRWTPDGLCTLYETAADYPVLARFDDRMRDLVRDLAAERAV